MRAIEGLEQASTSLLRRIATAHGVAHDEATSRSELVERLASRYADHETLRGFLASRAAGRESAALSAARAGGGEIRGFLLGRLLGRDEAEAARDLVESGLLFRTFSPLGPHRGEVYAVPEEVLAVLPESTDEGGERRAGRPERVESPRRELWCAGEPAYSLFALASFLRHEAEAGRSGHGARRGERSVRFKAEVAAHFLEPGGWHWQERWQFLRHVATLAGLLRPALDDGDPGLVTATFTSLLSTPSRLVSRVWRTYLRDRDWDDLARSGAARGEELSDQVDAPSLRTAVADALARLPAGEWIEVEGLSEWLRAASPTFMREQLDTRSLSLTDPDSGGTLWQEGSWQRVEAPFVRYLCLGPFFWLGALGADRAGSLVAVGSLGEALLRGAEPRSRRPDACEWVDDGEALLASSRVDLGVLLHAEQYLALVERGATSRYELKQERVAAAIERNGSVAECRTLLEELTRDSLPARVAEQLAAWEQKVGAYRLRPSVLLESASAEEQAVLEKIEELGPLLRKRLGPTVVEIPATQAEHVAELLRGAGHLPRVDAALRLMAGRRAYAALVDEQTLEFLLVSLLAFRSARPEQLTQLEGALSLLERLEELFPGERLQAMRQAASRLAGELGATVSRPSASRRRKRDR